MSAVRILIVAAVRLYREGMASCLGKRDDLAVVGTAANGIDALERVAALAPNVVLLDTATEDGVSLIRTLRETAPRVKTVLFAVENDERAIIASAEAGVAGYLPSDASLDDLTATIIRVTRGELSCPPSVAAALLRHVGAAATTAREHPGLVGLTAREREVLALIDAGLSNKEIAVRLRIEVATVKNHVHHLLDKLQVTSRAAAAAQLGPRRTVRSALR
jgi:two-component system nitrate/nitrite response regulator NarL